MAGGGGRGHPARATEALVDEQHPRALRARSRELARRFGAAVRARAGASTASIVDLGAGSGANFRALAPLIPGDQDWRLVDHDRALLSHQ